MFLVKNGKILPECAIKTDKGTKVVDVAWVSRERIKTIKDEAECSVAPEICIEVRSSNNTDETMEEKRKLYFASGAKEVWLCLDGAMSFYNNEGELERSMPAPDFPAGSSLRFKLSLTKHNC